MLPKHKKPPRCANNRGLERTVEESVITYINASTLHGPAMRVSASFSVCTYKGCSLDPMEGLDAPLCKTHAQMIAVQVLTMDAPPPRLEPKKRKADPIPGSVYIIQHGNRVKIGFTTQPKTRLACLPHERVIALIPGDRRLEHALLTKFKSVRTSGEWFEAHPELIAFAENLAQKAA